jgi:hypothetical protein
MVHLVPWKESKAPLHHRDHLVHLDLLLRVHHQGRQALLLGHLKGPQAMAHLGLQRDLHRVRLLAHHQGHLKDPHPTLLQLRRNQLKSQNMLLKTFQKRLQNLYKKNQNQFKMNQ